MKKLLSILAALLVSCGFAGASSPAVGLTLIPPGTVTDKVDLDIRAGIVNKSDEKAVYQVRIYLNGDKDMLSFTELTLDPGENHCVKYILDTDGMSGKNRVCLKVSSGDSMYVLSKDFEVVKSEIRSTRLIDGAWTGIYHWSEEEGKHWNNDIKKMTDSQWCEMVRSMHGIGMDIIVIQEVFRNQYYVGNHNLDVKNYQGRAFYPSELYPGRMDIAAEDPVEAILSEADKLGMSVMMGVGMFAWFDFTAESLEWHKLVAGELWEKYGHHDSFYGFYVSEECAGNLFNSEQTDMMKLVRKKEISDFFREFRKYTSSLAPEKPVMLATNSMGVPDGADAYPALLENLDILCPFGFARMPDGDLTGKEAADMLQGLCDEAGAHLWFDLEAFLFNPDMSLYPRPIDEIIYDLTLFENFEKILCYQYPGVFSNPDMSILIGEKRTEKLYKDYKEYMNKVIRARNNKKPVNNNEN